MKWLVILFLFAFAFGAFDETILGVAWNGRPPGIIAAGKHMAGAAWMLKTAKPIAAICAVGLMLYEDKK